MPYRFVIFVPHPGHILLRGRDSTVPIVDENVRITVIFQRRYPHPHHYLPARRRITLYLVIQLRIAIIGKNDVVPIDILYLTGRNQVRIGVGNQDREKGRKGKWVCTFILIIG